MSLAAIATMPSLPTTVGLDAIYKEHVSSSSSTSIVYVLPYVLSFMAQSDLEAVGLIDRESQQLCEQEWRLRVLARFGSLRFTTTHWRKVYKLRAYFQRKVVDRVTARVYFMNAKGETTCHMIACGKSMMCSKDRAVVYSRCERMFDLSLRINRSIQEISTLIGIVSVDDARGLLNEHINLMTSVASLRSSLLFESELFSIFPAPVLLDANTLLRGTYTFPDKSFFKDTTVMMQMWVSIDGLIYRPLAPPSVIDQHSTVSNTEQANVVDPPEPTQDASTQPNYNAIKLHELSGMTIHIDDNTLRYRLQNETEMCINALVGNTYLLYLFNPLQFRPMDWSYDAVVYVGETRYPLPRQREGVFLNSTTLALRVFLSYGKTPELRTSGDGDEGDDETSVRRERGGESSEPLGIPYDGDAEVFSLLIMATNRITKERHEVVNKSSYFSLRSSTIENAPITSTDQTNKSPRQHNLTHERHVHLPYDAMVCYSFSEEYTLQYVEFAIGFEALLNRLQISTFLPPLLQSPPSDSYKSSNVDLPLPPAPT